MRGQNLSPMFSHVVIFWTDPKNPAAVDELIAGANKFLKPIPGTLHFHEDGTSDGAQFVLRSASGPSVVFEVSAMTGHIGSSG